MMHGNDEDGKPSSGDATARAGTGAGIAGTTPVRAAPSRADAEPNHITSAFLVAFSAQRNDIERLVDSVKYGIRREGHSIGM